MRAEAQRGGTPSIWATSSSYALTIMLNLLHLCASARVELYIRYNPVHDPSHNCAIFQDLGSSLVVLQAATVVDFFGCLPGHCIVIVDAEQSYIQADMQCGPTWICLSPEARPSWWCTLFPDLRRSVRRLNKALYGHPDAGAYWAQQVDAHVKSVGVVLGGPEGPYCTTKSTYC